MKSFHRRRRPRKYLVAKILRSTKHRFGDFQRCRFKLNENRTDEIIEWNGIELMYGRFYSGLIDGGQKFAMFLGGILNSFGGLRNRYALKK